MFNIFDYLSWRGDIDFKTMPLNEIDGVIFASLSLLDLSEFAPIYPSKKKNTFQNIFKEMFAKYKNEDIHLGMIVPHAIVDLAEKSMNTVRFKDVEISNYINLIDNDKMMQFSAICFHFQDKIVISYCGTDDTLIGWQENLNLISHFPVPAEQKAVEYLENIANTYPNKKIYLVGHSKGGNLSTYAGIYASKEIQDKIITIYNYDGPGFIMEIDNEKFLNVKDKIYRIIPDFSIVGRLLNEYCGTLKIIKSTNYGIYQHDPFSWDLLQTTFVEAEAEKGAIKIEKGILQMINRLSDDEKSSLCDNLYTFITNTKKQTLTECANNKIALLRVIKDMQLKNALIFTELILLIWKNGGI